MLKRLSYATVGACVVTLALILVMSEIAEFFERPDSPVYMRVMDFIPGSGQRRLPARRMPEAQPERAQVGSGEIEANRLDDYQRPVDFDDGLGDIEVSVDLDAPPRN